MDKYEYRLKAEQIEKLVKKKDYKTAAKIADTIDWRRVKNLNMLYIVSEIYEQTERYGECMEILDIAYDRAPVGRMLLYRMTEVCTKMHNFEEAISLYREFVKAAPHDQSRYILKYQIYRERGSSVEDQIRILAEYKTHEYQEKWAYELAMLYDEAGMGDECVRECDELILWFSEGEYVTKALELKQKYEPLSAAQQEKYIYRSGTASPVNEDDFEEPAVMEFNTDRFSTVNLQAELAENLDELLKEDKTIELPELGLEDEAAEFAEPEEAFAEPEKPAAEEPSAKEDLKEDKTIELPELGLEGEAEVFAEAEEPAIEEDLKEDKTIELPELGLEDEPNESVEPEEPAIEEDLKEDKTIELPELGLEDEPNESVEPEEPAIEEDLKEDKTIELPELGLEGEAEVFAEPETSAESVEAPAEPAEAAAEEPKQSERKNVVIELPILEAFPEPEDFEDDADQKAGRPEPEAQPEPEFPDDPDRLEDPEKKQYTGQEVIDEILNEWENTKVKTEAMLQAGAREEQKRREQVKQETEELMKVIQGISELIPEDVQQILDELDEERYLKNISGEAKEELPPSPETDEAEDMKEEEEFSLDELDASEEELPAVELDDLPEDGRSGNMIQDLGRSLASKESEKAVNAGHLTREQARLFAYFTCVKGMSEQLSVLFKGNAQRGQTNSSKGNLTITGERGNGKTTLAIDIVKALQRQDQISGRKMAKISGQKLNTKDIYDVVSRLKGGALIIESAGGLSDATMMALSLAMESDTGGLLFILEDSTEEIQKLFRRNSNFASKFDHTIDIPVFTNDELVAFGKSYALEQGYGFDEFGILALYDRIGSRQTNDHLVTVAEVKELIDGAIERAEKGSIRHLFERVTKKSVDEFGNHLLREVDFQE